MDILGYTLRVARENTPAPGIPMCYSLCKSTPAYSQSFLFEITAFLTHLSHATSLDIRRYRLSRPTLLETCDRLQECRVDAIQLVGDDHGTIRLFPFGTNSPEVQEVIILVLGVIKYQNLYRTMLLVFSMSAKLWGISCNK